MPAEDIVVVGAGAAGLATAIFTRRLNPSRAVLLLDGAARPGAKILVSGGSRCNVTNVSVTERDFSGAASRRSCGACCAASRSPRRSPGSRGSASRFTRKSTANCSRTRTARATCSTRCCARRKPRASVLRAATRVVRRRACGRGFRLETSRGPIDAQPSCSRRAASRCRRRAATARARDRAQARAHDRADDPGAGAARRRRRYRLHVPAALAAWRRTSSCRSGSTARSPSGWRAPCSGPTSASADRSCSTRRATGCGPASRGARARSP